MLESHHAILRGLLGCGAEILNESGVMSDSGKPFSVRMVQNICVNKK